MLKSKILSKAILLSALLLVLFSCSTAWASSLEEQTDIQLINQLEVNLQTLKTKDEQSKLELRKVNQELTLCLEDLEKLNRELSELRITSAQQETSLTKANESLESLNNELKKEQAKNRRKNILITILVGGIIMAVAH